MKIKDLVERREKLRKAFIWCDLEWEQVRIWDELVKIEKLLEQEVNTTASPPPKQEP